MSERICPNILGARFFVVLQRVVCAAELKQKPPVVRSDLHGSLARCRCGRTQSAHQHARRGLIRVARDRCRSRPGDRIRSRTAPADWSCASAVAANRTQPIHAIKILIIHLRRSIGCSERMLSTLRTQRPPAIGLVVLEANASGAPAPALATAAPWRAHPRMGIRPCLRSSARAGRGPVRDCESPCRGVYAR
jgi:hypothetical protein